MASTPGFDIVYDRGAYLLDVDVNDGIYVNNERQQSEHNSGISFPVIRKEYWERALSQAQQDHERQQRIQRDVHGENQNTHEQIKVKVPGIKSSKYWKLKAGVNGTRKASKHWQEYSSDKLVTKMLFQQNDINPCIYKRFCDDLDLEQDGDDFLVCGVTLSLEKLTEEFNGNFLVKESEIVSLKPEHQRDTHFLKRRISVDEFGWHVELDQRYVKSLLDAMAMNHCKRRKNWMQRNIESSDPVLESVST